MGGGLRMDGQMDRQLDRWVDGWMGGWMDGWTGQMSCECVFPCSQNLD